MKASDHIHKQGAALIVVLSLVALMMVVTVAFFSSALLNRQIGASSAANLQGDLLAQTATELILADIGQEIRAGSHEDDFAAGEASRSIYRPLSATDDPTLAPSMVLQRVVATAGNPPASLWKQSLSGRAFFDIAASGYKDHTGLGSIPNRASDVNTSGDAPRRGRAISPQRWNMPRFAAETESIPSPDWIYLSRSGENPTQFSQELTDFGLENEEYVIGRFAYNLYEVGGLADINVIGNSLDAEQNRRRGRLHQVTLQDAPPPLTLSDFPEFLTWRIASSEPVNPDAADGLFDPKRDFLRVRSGAQTFIGRQDLLRYAKRTGSPIPEEALPFLTTFSRDVNAPGYQPDPTRPMLPASPPPEELNPALLEHRFPSETVLGRGSDPEVTVPAGTPVVARRFPLSKLNLLGEEDPDPATLAYYFGLRKNADGSFEYIAGIAEGGGIRVARLSEIATLGREPNFFELLQAVIVTGSLGRNAGNTYTLDNPRDELRNLHVFQIGANIIDQWDANDYPTTLNYPSGNAGEWLTVYGVENLPYINNVALLGHRPVHDRERFQVWGLFDVWNPHQNAVTPPMGIAEFRLHPRSGQCRVNLLYMIQRDTSNYTPLYAQKPPMLESPFQSISDLNHGRELIFSASQNYSEPWVVGSGEPVNADSLPGILFADIAEVPPAIPVKSERSKILQEKLNDLIELEFPYTADKEPQGVDEEGNRIYPPGTIFTNLNESYWEKATDGDGSLLISARFGVKAHNVFRIYPGDFSERITIELQYRREGETGWRTYQVMNEFLPLTGDASVSPAHQGVVNLAIRNIIQAAEKSPDDLLKNSHHSMPDFDPQSRFYGWRQPDGSINLFKFDPRTIRFGHSFNYRETLGTTIRQSATAYTGSGDEAQTDWRVVRGDIAGTFTSIFGDLGFEWHQPTGSRYVPFGLIANIPEGSVGTGNPSRYKDRDGVVRPADGYLGALPTAPGRLAERPLILNRSFRTVGELGYAFRDLPWKSLDFFSSASGDLGLLDVFSLDETESDPPVVAGRVNLNTCPREVLAALLSGSAKHPFQSAVADSLSPAEALALADKVIAARADGPFRNAGDLVRRAFAPDSFQAPASTADAERNVISEEAAIRTLASVGATRTLNLMIDVVVQTGRIPPSAGTLADFAVSAERRYWVHLAIDRFTGEIVERQTELVHE